MGTLAVLDLAGRRGLLDFRKAIQALEFATNFRITRTLRDRLLREHTDFEGGSKSGIEPSE
ncbi:MAG: DUF3368 domain-containing protein [Pirellulales bacterium]